MELEKNGTGGNDFIEISNYAILTKRLKSEHVDDKWQNPWKRVWVVLVPKDGEYYRNNEANLTDSKSRATVPMPKVAHVLIALDTIKSQEELDQFIKQSPVLRGTIVNNLHGTDKLRKALPLYFPETNLDNIYCIEVGRTPKSGMIVFLYYLGGIIAVFVGIRVMYMD